MRVSVHSGDDGSYWPLDLVSVSVGLGSTVLLQDGFPEWLSGTTAPWRTAALCGRDKYTST